MTKGIHHITAIASHAQQTVEFYTHILGLRLVKKTVNQDDTGTYHLFFGDNAGHPGMDLTFFIFLPARQGSRGTGQVTKTSLAVPQSSLPFWQERLKKFQVKQAPIMHQFGYDRIVFFDADDQQLELVGVEDTALTDSNTVWTTNEVTQSEAIRHFHSATLTVPGLAGVEPVLTEVFGYTKADQDDRTHLYQVSGSSRAHLLEVSEAPTADPGIGAAGTVHHIAFRARDEEEQLLLRDKVLELGLRATTVVDRFYFKSVYFRIPSGILFEIATDGPGFAADELPAELGRHLSLPPFLEADRSRIEAQLEPLTYDF